MTSIGYAQKLDELDRLLNDPDVPMQPALIWRLLDEVVTIRPQTEGAALPGDRHALLPDAHDGPRHLRPLGL
jgi:hypothetical protein